MPFVRDAWVTLTMPVRTTVGDSFEPQAMANNLGAC